MSIYTQDAADALDAIREAGAAVTWTRNSGDPNYIITTISGYAMRARGLPDTYRQLSLVESSNPTLLFAASTFGSLVKVGDTVVWDGTTLTAIDVSPTDPDGAGPIICRVVVRA
jgi:hypothetical protein